MSASRNARERLIAQAQIDHPNLPAGSFSEYQLVRIRRKINSKDSVAFYRHEHAVARPSDIHAKEIWVYSRWLKTDVKLSIADVEFKSTEEVA